MPEVLEPGFDPELLDRWRRFEPLYKSAAWLGPASILREYLGLRAGNVAPLSISHGVDFGHLNGAMDATTVEPVHWAYNRSIAREAEKVKPCALVPHPWLLLRVGKLPRPGKGTLVVGPPPGPENDRGLCREIERQVGGQVTVLIKARGKWREAMAFWEAAGHRAVTAGVGDSQFYRNLYQIMLEHDRVVGCTFSSALIFAAALGRRIQLLRNYRYLSFETADYLERANFESPPARAMVRLFAEAAPAEVTREAERVLGAELDFAPAAIRREITTALNRAGNPINPAIPRWGPFNWLRREAALRTGRPGLLQEGSVRRFLRRRSQKVIGLDIDEISVWLDGPNDRNLIANEIPYVRGVTEPGSALVQY